MNGTAQPQFNVPSLPPPSRSFPLLWVILGGAILVAVLVGVMYLVSREAVPETPPEREAVLPPAATVPPEERVEENLSEVSSGSSIEDIEGDIESTDLQILEGFR